MVCRSAVQANVRAQGYPPPISSHLSAEVTDLAASVNVRRLSIPPSMILRPFMEHGPLPLSPTKEGMDSEARPFDYPSQPNHPEQRASRKRAETSGMLMCVMANALKRRMTDAGGRLA